MLRPSRFARRRPPRTIRGFASVLRVFDREHVSRGFFGKFPSPTDLYVCRTRYISNIFSQNRRPITERRHCRELRLCRDDTDGAFGGRRGDLSPSRLPSPPLSSPFVKYSTRYVFCQYTNRVFRLKCSYEKQIYRKAERTPRRKRADAKAACGKSERVQVGGLRMGDRAQSAGLRSSDRYSRFFQGFGGFSRRQRLTARKNAIRIAFFVYFICLTMAYISRSPSRRHSRRRNIFRQYLCCTRPRWSALLTSVRRATSVSRRDR